MTTELQFADEEPPANGANAWSLLIVDDEHEVHAVTMLALEEFRYAGKRLRFLHAYSGGEAKELLRRHPDIAVMLLDVVMETERAGLDVVEYTRNDLHNRLIRIVLRTGQPGQAPELDVITRYDINDYKYKTELTRQRLYTTVYSALSSYRDLIALDISRRGLEKVIAASAALFELRSIEHFAQGVLEQLTGLLFLDRDALILGASGIATAGRPLALRIVAGTGGYEALVGQEAQTALPPAVFQRIEAAATPCAGAVFGADYFTVCQPSGDGMLIFYVGSETPLGEPDRRLIELFCRNVAVARDYLLLRAGAGRHA